MPASPDLFAPAVADHGVVVLDGGLATTLAARGADLSDHLWSARLLADDPALIHAVHGSFLDAGADVVITASYQASYEGFAEAGADTATTTRLLRRSVEIAAAARHDHARPEALVAASIGPYGAALADGSEYRGDYDVSAAVLQEFHERRLAVLSEAGADLLAIETLPSAKEARVLLELLADVPGPPAWITFTTADAERISDGAGLAGVAAEAAAHPRVVAVGVNCVPPARIGPILHALADLPVPRVVYPNLGARFDETRRTWQNRDPDAWPDPREWRRLGAQLIGGCCGTDPGDIRRLHRRITDPPP